MMLVVPTLTRHDLLQRMLGSVDGPVDHLVVIDNSGRGVDIPDGPWQESTLLIMPSNLGVAASWNLAIKMAHRDPFVMICSDDMWWPEGAMDRFVEQSAEDRLVVSATWPHWCAFTIGMRLVHTVGLFDEGYYPAYFEDTEYQRRLGGHGLALTHGPAVGHDNASTLNTPGRGFSGRNNTTHKSNGALFASGKHHGFDPYRWRAQSWA
ncbi:MAG TPA: glycosyltransferase [Acidimicrobiia bacterium]